MQGFKQTKIFLTFLLPLRVTFDPSQRMSAKAACLKYNYPQSKNACRQEKKAWPQNPIKSYIR
jgi:hypothetical protein